ncbi:abc transporter [Lucifera butyrica]|uniref:Abc transporter n=1 Tax=Lucifera butyrica TaxID=1351585 RepID=A0A498R564_9FIRM|nr:sugar ABC transporter ATP-binding protein [Lucifera butyrica]VBB06594.1 abc transporter [Lucifera butyrica]
MTGDDIVNLRHISKTFGGIKALDDVSLDVKRGEVHALVGENGAGKSTLIKVLAGVHYPDDGAEIIINGERTVVKNPLDAIRKGISVIYQDISLFPNLTVAENICIGNEAVWGRQLDWKKINELATAAIQRVGARLNPKTVLKDLNLASQQIVAIARAISFNAGLIVMDEPTSTLSAGEVENLYKIIDTLRRENIAVLFISHKFDEIYRVADRVTVFRDGKYIASRDIAAIDRRELIRLMVGREVEYLSLTARSLCKDKILKVENLTKKGNFRNVSFELKKGEILGITGLVGSGRTEIAKALFGLNRPDTGEIILEGRPVVIGCAADALHYGIAYVPENRQLEGLILADTVQQNITLPILDTIRNQFGCVDKEKGLAITQQYIEKMDVRPPDPGKRARFLSGGNQQKVVLAKWLATNPKILIADEPTSGVDIGAKIEIHKTLRELADSGIGVIVISSELPEILAVSDRILIMRRGRVAGVAAKKDATQESIMAKALGTAEQAAEFI